MAIKAWLGKHKDQLLIAVIAGLILLIVPTVGSAISGLVTSEGLWSFLVAEVPLPFWVLLVILGIIFGFGCLLLRVRNQASTLTIKIESQQANAAQQQADADARVATLQAEIEELRNPTLLSLDENDVDLIYAVAALYDIGREMTATQIAAAHDVPSVKIQAIADRLKHAGLLQRRRTLESPLKLTEKGRSYLGRPDVFDGYSAFREDFMKSGKSFPLD